MNKVTGFLIRSEVQDIPTVAVVFQHKSNQIQQTYHSFKVSYFLNYIYILFKKLFV